MVLNSLKTGRLGEKKVLVSRQGCLIICFLFIIGSVFVRTQEVVGMRRTELDRGRETEKAREWGMKGKIKEQNTQMRLCKAD